MFEGMKNYLMGSAPCNSRKGFNFNSGPPTLDGWNPKQPPVIYLSTG